MPENVRKSLAMRRMAAAAMLVVLMAAASPSFANQDSPVTYPAGLKTALGEHRIMVELARTPQAMERGLMYRRELEEGQGMLFIYDRPLIPSFWMKNMFMTIDIIFIGGDHSIIKIFERVPPCPAGQVCRTYSPAEPVVYVLEVTGGYSGKIGLQPGDHLLFTPPP